MPILTKIPVASTGPTSTAFVPTTVSNCTLWLDASDTATITQNATSNISQWNDKSGSGLNAVSNSVIGWAVPTYVSTGTVKYVSMQPNQALYVPGFPYTTSWSVFSCMCNVTLGARWYISPYSDLGLVMMGMGHGNNKIFPSILGGGADVTGSHIEFTSAQNTNGTGAFTYYRDGSLIDSNNTANSIPSTTVRMGIGANGANTFDAAGTYYPFEIIMFNQYLGDTDRRNVEGYLAQKWGLTANLPPGHPGLTSNYLVSSAGVASDVITFIRASGPLNTGFILSINPSVTISLAVPSAPIIGTATPSIGQVTVTWTAPVSDGGSTITNYIITSSPLGGNSPLTVGNVTSATITGLSNGTAYTFTVVAVNGVGNSASSSSSTSVTTYSVSSAPIIGTPTEGYQQITVAWSAPASNGGSAITNYIITSSPSGGNSPLTVGNVTSAIITGLPNATSYTFTVVAVNGVGNSASSSSSISVSTFSVPGAPTITYLLPGNGQVTVTWSPPVSTGGTTITNYIITSSPSAGNSPLTVGNVTSGTITGLTTTVSYTFTVVAVNIVGNSSASAASAAVFPYIQAGSFMIVTSITSPNTINYGTTTDVQNGVTYSLSSIYNSTPQPLVSFFDIPTRLDSTVNNKYWGTTPISFSGVTTTSITTTQNLVTNPTIGIVMYLAIHTTGTANNNSTSLTVASTAGVIVGMVPYTSGPATNKFGSGAVVSAISGTTITLSLQTVASINNGSDIWFLIP